MGDVVEAIGDQKDEVVAILTDIKDTLETLSGISDYAEQATGAAPTAAQLVAKFGAANTHSKKWKALFKDTTEGAVKLYPVYCDGTNYFLGAALTQAS